MSLSQIDWLWVRVRWRERVFLSESQKKKIRCLNPRWQNSRWLPSSGWVRMNEWSFFCANGGNQSWQVWVSLRGKTKRAESKMVEFKLAEIKMAAIIKLSEKEWDWVRESDWVRLLCKMAECFWVNLRWKIFKMDPTIKLSEGMSEFLCNGWIH